MRERRRNEVVAKEVIRKRFGVWIDSEFDIYRVRKDG